MTKYSHPGERALTVLFSPVEEEALARRVLLIICKKESQWV
jgi:hypothetical protein